MQGFLMDIYHINIMMITPRLLMIMTRTKGKYNIDDVGIADEFIPEQKYDVYATVNDDTNEKNENIYDDGVAVRSLPKQNDDYDGIVNDDKT